MKRRNLFVGVAILTMMALAGCAGQQDNPEDEGLEIEQLDSDSENETSGDEEVKDTEDAQDNEETPDTEDTADTADTTDTTVTDASGIVSICDEDTELDYDKDYVEEIALAVANAELETDSFEEEFAAMDEIQDAITRRRSQDQTQYEMNVASMWYYQVWETELNSLYERALANVDDSEKAKLERGQEAWEAMLDDAALQTLGPSDQGGSIYPLMFNSFKEEACKNRSNYLASVISDACQGSFVLPDITMGGCYIDDQGTGEPYSIMSIHMGWESGYEANISLYRLGELTGEVTEESDNTCHFTSDDGSVAGTITYGWDGATFEITEVSGDTTVYSVGDIFEFAIVY